MKIFISDIKQVLGDLVVDPGSRNMLLISSKMTFESANISEFRDK